MEPDRGLARIADTGAGHGNSPAYDGALSSKRAREGSLEGETKSLVRYFIPGGAVKDIVSAPSAPKAIGPYSQAVKANDFVFVSGQLALDPATGQLLGGDAALQTAQALENLKTILEAAGSSLHKVVKTTVYLKSMGDFVAMNTVYEKYFKTAPPARSALEAARLPATPASKSTSSPSPR
ncbi:MAG: Rid family detoxifying hydrolase [Candidatus Acidiferrales bacterium]